MSFGGSVRATSGNPGPGKFSSCRRWSYRGG